MNNEDLLTELRWALDNIGASRDYFRIGNALESAIKVLAPSATVAPDRPDWARQLPGAEIYDRAARGKCGYDRTASLNAGHYVCTCGCSHYTTKEPSK